MSVWILEFELALLLFASLLPVILIPLLAGVYRKFGRMPILVVLLTLATGLYACGLLAFTFFPLPEAGSDFCDDRTLYEYWRPVPFTSIGEAVSVVVADPVGGLRSSVFLQVAFNVLLFVPLGFLLAYWARRPLWVAAAAGFGGSLLIEVSQGTAIFGIYPCPYRVAEVDDILLNTSGAVVGWLVGWGVTKLWPYRDPEPVPGQDPPSRSRRAVAAIADLLGFVGVTVFAQLAIGLVLTGPFGVSREADSEVLLIVPFVVVGLMFLVVPLLRDDRATPGQIAVMVRPTVAGLASSEHSELKTGAVTAKAKSNLEMRVTWWRVCVRFLVRFLWLVVFPPLFFAVLVADVVLALVRKDQRSLVDLLSGTEMRGHVRDRVLPAKRSTTASSSATEDQPRRPDAES